MHASIWKFDGNPDDLASRNDAMITEIPPANMKLHVCLRAPDGIVMVDGRLVAPGRNEGARASTGTLQTARPRCPTPGPDDA
jgi:hypothetical protein